MVNNKKNSTNQNSKNKTNNQKSRALIISKEKTNKKPIPNKKVSTNKPVGIINFN